MNEKEIKVKTNNDKINDKKDLSLSERERLIRAYEKKMKIGSSYKGKKEKKNSDSNINLCDTHWDGA